MKKYLKYLLAGVSALAFAFVLGVKHIDHNAKAYTLQSNGTLISDNILYSDNIDSSFEYVASTGSFISADDVTKYGFSDFISNIYLPNGSTTYTLRFEFLNNTKQYYTGGNLCLFDSLGNKLQQELPLYTDDNLVYLTFTGEVSSLKFWDFRHNDTIEFNVMMSLGSYQPYHFEIVDAVYYSSNYIVDMQNSLALAMCDLFDSPSCVGVSGNVPLSTNAFTNLINNNYVIPYINKVSLQDSRVPAVISSVKSTYDDSYSSCMLVDGATCSLVSLPSGIITDDVRSIPYYITAIVSNISQSDYVSISTEFYSQGYKEGSELGYERGKRDGINIGYSKGLEEDGVLGDAIIATASTPVTILSQFLSFDLLGINLWFLVAGFVTLGIIIWLIKRFFK